VDPILAAMEYNFSYIVNWDYRRGHFPLTPDALSQMEFDHVRHPAPPKYVFPAAVLLFLCPERTEAEEEAYQRLSSEWEYWFDNPLNYDFLKSDPPKRMGLNSDEVNWCKVKVEYLVNQIKSESDRARLGLPAAKKRVSRATEAADLLPGPSSGSHNVSVSASAPQAAASSANAAANLAPQAAARSAAAASESVAGDGGHGVGVAEKKGGGNHDVVRKTKRRRKNSQSVPVAADVQSVPVASRSMEQGTPVDTEEKTTVRAYDGKTVSLKDGRIVAAGNDLKKSYPNNYRSPGNTTLFYGRELTLGEAFKLACLVHYGPNLPIETSGHLSMRTALFRTAAFYALTEDEAREIMEHESVADFYYFLVKSAKQLVYAYSVEARLVFGDTVFSRHTPSRLLRGTSNIISLHYAETELII
jgi:hypothetical protein